MTGGVRFLSFHGFLFAKSHNMGDPTCGGVPKMGVEREGANGAMIAKEVCHRSSVLLEVGESWLKEAC